MLTLREKNLTYPKMGWHICFKGIFSFFWGVMFFYFFVWMRKQVSKQPGRVLQAREPGSVRKGVCPPGKLENGKKKVGTNGKLGGGFKDLLFSPLFGDDFHFDEHIFQLGWNHQLEKCPKGFGPSKMTAIFWKEMTFAFHSTGVFGDLLGMKYLVNLSYVWMMINHYKYKNPFWTTSISWKVRDPVLFSFSHEPWWFINLPSPTKTYSPNET